jgi:hypothetical protein
MPAQIDLGRVNLVETSAQIDLGRHLVISYHIKKQKMSNVNSLIETVPLVQFNIVNQSKQLNCNFFVTDKSSVFISKYKSQFDEIVLPNSSSTTKTSFDYEAFRGKTINIIFVIS